jgi:hypothetical protein
LTIGNPIKEAEEVVEEEGQEEMRNSKLKLKLKQKQEDIQKWQLDYTQLVEHIKNPQYISRDFLLQMKRYKVECQLYA